MSRVVVLARTAGLCLPAGASAADEAKYSGRVATAGGKEIALEVLGPWKPGAHPITRVIELGPSTRVERVARVTTPPPGRWPGGFEATPLTAADVHPGEFVTVAAERHGRRLVAVTITVVAPK